MSIDYWEAQQEAAYEEYMEELYESEFRDRAVDEFTEERLRSYYVANPNILVSSLQAFREAKSVLQQSPTGSLLLSSIAIEVGIKSGILKPVVYGFIHSETAADAISDMVIKQSGIDRFRKLLVQLLADLSEVDLATFKRSGASSPLWDERSDIQKIRNRIAHRGEQCTSAEAQHAFYVASGVLLELVPAILASLGLSIGNGGQVE